MTGKVCKIMFGKKFEKTAWRVIVGLMLLAGLVVGLSTEALAEVAADGLDGGTSGGVSESAWGAPEFYLKAINPGYVVDGVANVGEMIEIGYSGGGEFAYGDLSKMVSLAGISISYTNSSGNETVLLEFSEHFFLAGETILLRLASSPGSELANMVYSKTLAFKAGPLVLRRDGEVLDSVCWTGKDGCVAEFKSAEPTSLVRDLTTGEWRHVVGYEGEYQAENLWEKPPGGADEGADDYSGETEVSRCNLLGFSEILSYYEEKREEQFIEFYNMGAEQVLSNGCQIRYKNKLYPLTGIVGAEGYLVRYLGDFALTKNPTSANVLELVDVDGSVVDSLTYPNGQKKGAAYALIGYDEGGEEIWKVTYAPTPGEPNNYQEFRSCAEGKVINEATGNCVKVTTVAEKICGEGQYLNLLTGRCKKIEEVKETVCKEGYYLNEETGRCRKIVENSGADYALVPETYEEGTSFVALYAVLGVVGVGLGYVGWEFRHEIRRLVGRVWRRFRQR